MSERLHRPSRNAGFTLVELLVVLALLGVVGTIVTASMVRGLQADAQARSRIEAFEDMQVAMERMSREVRAADPLVDASADRIEVRVRRDGTCFRYVYERVGTDLRSSEQRSNDDCATFGTAAERVLVRDIDPGVDVFEYQNSEGGTPSGVTDITFVRITFLRNLELGQRPVTVSTVVGLRNS